ncbi:MAG: hypothetical protein N4A41_00510 [Crocinitomicaceae bacterium]|jgi:hypothetical protein|nr:hypothetical protein [Crocinitomicaceae bacterium]
MDYRSNLKADKARLEKELEKAVQLRNETHVKNDMFIPRHNAVVQLRIRIQAIKDRIFFYDKPSHVLDTTNASTISQYIK